ncbi:hypothetical protein DFH09DRAFT_1150273 [Mycena vulgaris]|nr:hypothetical protein DFH09DRAFT_1150273 [Mycena vulgaris]
MVATEAVFCIQELCDQIADHIALSTPSQDDLKSLALVCQALCISSQSQIFRHVILNPYELPGSDGVGTRTAPELALSAFHRLSAILATSPHLLRSIHHLSVFAKAEVLEPLSNIRFPALRKIRFDFDFLDLLDEGQLHILHGVRGFIGLPSIHEVELIALGELPLDSFASLFETCSPNLKALTFSDVELPATLPSVSLPRPRERRAQIKKLVLINTTENLGNWFLSPSCPFEFTGLVDVETGRARDPALVQVLTSARLNISRLFIDGDFDLDIDLSDFPALTCLELYCPTVEVISSLKPDNCVETVVLHVLINGFGMGPSLQETDSSVFDSPMPALQQVEVRIRGPSNPRFRLDSVEHHFMQLHARGLLIVTDNRH